MPIDAADVHFAPGLSVAIDRFAYDDAVFFEDFAIRLEAGRCTVLLGPSGCGKTTLLRLIAGHLSGARVKADDHAPLAGRIAVMAQQDLLLPWLDVRDNVMLGYRLRGMARRERRALAERADEILALVGLDGWGGARPAQLSGGMRQRVALARTLMEDRPLVLMDEPFSAVDAITRYRLQDLAAGLLAGRTTLLVTHDPLEAIRLGHALYVITGQPARLGQVIVPPGAPPRDAAGSLLQLQARLLGELAGSPGTVAA
jgi:putative hydroxymethylpyrimidine transport system ATP-binding protein